MFAQFQNHNVDKLREEMAWFWRKILWNSDWDLHEEEIWDYEVKKNLKRNGVVSKKGKENKRNTKPKNKQDSQKEHIFTGDSIWLFYKQWWLYTYNYDDSNNGRFFRWERCVPDL